MINGTYDDINRTPYTWWKSQKLTPKENFNMDEMFRRTYREMCRPDKAQLVNALRNDIISYIDNRPESEESVVDVDFSE